MFAERHKIFCSMLATELARKLKFSRPLCVSLIHLSELYQKWAEHRLKKPRAKRKGLIANLVQLLENISRKETVMAVKKYNFKEFK